MAELIEKRTRFSKTIQNANNQTTEIYSRPIHYSNEGKWEDVDLTTQFNSSGIGYFEFCGKAEKSDCKFYFGDIQDPNNKALWCLDLGDDNWINIKPLTPNIINDPTISAQASSPYPQDKIIFNDVWDNVDVEIIPTSTGAKTNIIIKVAITQNEFEFSLKVSNDKTKDDILIFGNPVIVGHENEELVTKSFGTVNINNISYDTIKYTVDNNWLSQQTSFPIIIDPVEVANIAGLSSIEDTSMVSSVSNRGYGVSTTIIVGPLISSSRVFRGLIKLTDFSSLLRRRITAAKLQLTINSTANMDGVDVAKIGMYEVLQANADWEQGSADNEDSIINPNVNHRANWRFKNENYDALPVGQVGPGIEWAGFVDLIGQGLGDLKRGCGNPDLDYDPIQLDFVNISKGDTGNKEWDIPTDLVDTWRGNLYSAGLLIREDDDLDSYVFGNPGVSIPNRNTEVSFYSTDAGSNLPTFIITHEEPILPTNVTIDSGFDGPQNIVRWSNPVDSGGNIVGTVRIYRSEGKFLDPFENPDTLVYTQTGEEEIFYDADVEPGKIYYYTATANGSFSESTQVSILSTNSESSFPIVTGTIANLFDIVLDTNDRMIVRINEGNPIDIVVPAGSYSASALSTEISNQINDSNVIVEDDGNNKIRFKVISNSLENASRLSIEFLNAGGNSIYSTIGIKEGKTNGYYSMSDRLYQSLPNLYREADIDEVAQLVLLQQQTADDGEVYNLNAPLAELPSLQRFLRLFGKVLDNPKSLISYFKEFYNINDVDLKIFDVAAKIIGFENFKLLDPDKKRFLVSTLTSLYTVAGNKESIISGIGSSVFNSDALFLKEYKENIFNSNQYTEVVSYFASLVDESTGYAISQTAFEIGIDIGDGVKTFNLKQGTFLHYRIARLIEEIIPGIIVNVSPKFLTTSPSTYSRALIFQAIDDSITTITFDDTGLSNSAHGVLGLPTGVSTPITNKLIDYRRSSLTMDFDNNIHYMIAGNSDPYTYALNASLRFISIDASGNTVIDTYVAPSAQTAITAVTAASNLNTVADWNGGATPPNLTFSSAGTFLTVTNKASGRPMKIDLSFSPATDLNIVFGFTNKTIPIQEDMGTVYDTFHYTPNLEPLTQDVETDYLIALRGLGLWYDNAITLSDEDERIAKYLLNNYIIPASVFYRFLKIDVDKISP